jgi:Kyakuja-Dileera-Zisupton transposase
MTFSRMLVIDGNNSAKRISQLGSHSAIDTLAFEESDYILPRSFVDSFADEVASHQTSQNEAGDITDEDLDDSPTGNSTDESPCWKNWKAAAAEEKKRMWGIYDETGIFACACRHGQILWFTDMVRSGEL